MSDYDNAMTAGPAQALKQHVNAFRAGRAEAPSAPASPGKALAAGSGPPEWGSVRERVAGMSNEAKALAARQAEILAVAGQGLAGRPYAERKSILAHMAPHLAALGVGGENGGGPIDAFDPTDANIARAVGEAVILRGMLGGASNESAAAGTLEPGGQGGVPQAVTAAP